MVSYLPLLDWAPVHVRASGPCQWSPEQDRWGSHLWFPCLPADRCKCCSPTQTAKRRKQVRALEWLSNKIQRMIMMHARPVLLWHCVCLYVWDMQREQKEMEEITMWNNNHVFVFLIWHLSEQSYKVHYNERMWWNNQTGLGNNLDKMKNWQQMEIKASLKGVM